MVFEMPSCGGCRTCEAACSFKHKGEFAPSVSSIKILDKEQGSGYLLLLVEKGDGSNLACDGCKDFQIPLCVQYCREDKELTKILKEFMAKTEEREDQKP